MLSKINLRKTFLCTLLLLTIEVSLHAQSNSNHSTTETLNNTILKLDNEFWKSYNTCDMDTFKTFFIEDFEFYHDKGGLTSGLTQMMKMVETGLCGSENPRVRRAVVKGSVHVYPLHNYGAIITGEHLFYVTEKGKKERLTESAKFTHIWQYKNEQWKMTRALSYDHQPTL